MNVTIMILLVVAVSLTVYAAQQQQQIKQKAAEVEPTDSLSRVEVDFGNCRLGNDNTAFIHQMSVGQKCHASALAYNKTNNPIFENITYSWGISSNNSIGTLSSDGNISSFYAQNIGDGDIWVIAQKDNIQTEKAVMIKIVPAKISSKLTNLSFSISLPELIATASGNSQNLTVEILDPITNSIVKNLIISLTYNPINNKFEGKGDIDWVPTSETYNLKIKVEKYLSELVSGVELIENKENIISTISSPTIGDIDGNNAIDIADYGVIRDCFDSNKSISNASSKFISQQKCASHTQKNNADLNEDNFINQIDYNLFLKSLNSSLEKKD